jgi:hypothetical protein
MSSANVACLLLLLLLLGGGMVEGPVVGVGDEVVGGGSVCVKGSL